MYGRVKNLADFTSGSKLTRPEGWINTGFAGLSVYSSMISAMGSGRDGGSGEGSHGDGNRIEGTGPFEYPNNGWSGGSYPQLFTRCF